MTRFKTLNPLETQIQCAAMEAIRLKSLQDERYCNIIAVPNGGYGLPPRVGARLKREGLGRGYPDLVVDLGCHGYYGLRIEVKRPDGEISPDQRIWKRRLEHANYAHGYCYTPDDILGLIAGYFAQQVFEMWLVDLYRYGSERNRTGQVINVSADSVGTHAPLSRARPKSRKAKLPS